MDSTLRRRIGLALLASALASSGAMAQVSGLVYHNTYTCVIADVTLTDNVAESIFIRGKCGVPDLAGDPLETQAKAAAVTLRISGATAPGEVRVSRANVTPPSTDVIKFDGSGEDVYSSLIVAMCDRSGPDPCPNFDIRVRAIGSDVDLRLTVRGYFDEAPPGPQGPSTLR